MDFDYQIVEGVVRICCLTWEQMAEIIPGLTEGCWDYETNIYGVLLKVWCM